jgi:hypothetical protein
MSSVGGGTPSVVSVAVASAGGAGGGTVLRAGALTENTDAMTKEAMNSVMEAMSY